MTTTDERPNAGKAVAKAGGKHLARKIGWLATAKIAFWVVVALLLLTAVMAAGAVASKKTAAPTGSGCGPAAAFDVPAGGITPVPITTIPGGLVGEQIPNAQAIGGVALALGLGERGVQIGVVAAITEAGLRNLNYGDISSKTGKMTTSRGMFQMMDPWGTLADRLNPVTAATIFFTIDKGPGVRGLMHIPGWETMSVTDAAQAVEGSQFSGGENYQRNLAQAQQVTADLMAGVTGSAGPGASVQPVACQAPAGGGPVTPFTGQMNLSQDPTTYGWTRAANQVPFAWQGHQFGKVAAGTQALWSAMLAELVPQIPGGLNADLGCFENRPNVNSPGKWSIHSWGLACDLNSGVNSNGVTAQSLQGRQFALPMNTGAIAARYCMVWGGDFKGTPDPMHLEIHCTPQQVAQIIAGPTPITTTGGTP